MAIRYNPLTQQVEQVDQVVPGSASGGVPPLGGEASGVVPTGTLKTIGGYVYQWDGSRWYNTGVADPSGSQDNAPNVGLNPATGRYEYFTVGPGGRAVFNGVAAPPVNMTPGQSSSYNVSQSYQDPRALELQRMEIEQRAEQAGLDRTARANESAAERAQRLQLQLDQQGFTRGENAADRSFRQGESAADRAFRAGESATDRAMRAAEFAQTYGLNRAQFEAQQAQAESEFNRRKSADALAAAKQYADLINTVDPNAFDAFLRTGGGVIANSIAAGGDALSQRAALPAARTQRALDGINASSFTSTQSPSLDVASPQSLTIEQQGGMPGAYGYNSKGAYTWDQAGNVKYLANGTPAPASLGAALTAGVSTPAAQNAPSIEAQRNDANNRMAAASVPEWVPRFAFGTGMAQDKFIAGDSTDPGDPGAGGAKPEMIDINDPEGNATATVTPLEKPGTGSKLGALFDALSDLLEDENPMERPGKHQMPDGSMMDDSQMAPRFAYGTDPTMEVTAADQPYIQNVLDFRRNATVPDYNPFDVSFRNVNPFSRASYFAGRQTRYGIPVAAQEFEAQRFAVPGQARGIMGAQGY